LNTDIILCDAFLAIVGEGCEEHATASYEESETYAARDARGSPAEIITFSALCVRITITVRHRSRAGLHTWTPGRAITSGGAAITT
jgi:hypothetical protein